MKSLNRVIKKIVDKFGDTVRIKRRVENVDEEKRVFYTYKDPEVIKGMVTPVTADSFLLDLAGIRIDAEYLATFTPETEIEEGDLVEIDDEWYEVVKKFKRKEDFIETLLRKRIS